MAEIVDSFSNLSNYYSLGLTWEEIEDMYEKDPDEAATDIPLLLQEAIDNPEVLSSLLAVSYSICSVRDGEPGDTGDDANCWEAVLRVSPRNDYLAFIYALVGLTSLDAANMTYGKLSLAAANVYFLSLTLPGAKGYHIYEENVLIHCLKVFTLAERIQNPDVSDQLSKQDIIDVWVRISTFCDNWKLLLRYVHFKDNKEVRDEMLKKLVRILYMNYEKGYVNAYAMNLHKKCFEIFEELLHSHNGEPEETLMKILNMTVHLHTYPPKPKNLSGGGASLECEHISEWFIKCMTKYPTHLVKVLKFYIECIITNPIKSWKTEQIQRSLDYAAKYDAAMFTRCNESCVEFLCKAIYAEEATLRGRVIDMMSRILQLDSKVDWEMFRHEVSSIPREVHLIKELILSIKDNNNSVKLKAVQALHSALTKGSAISMKIMEECVKYTKFFDLNVKLPPEPPMKPNEVRFKKPQVPEAKYSFEGHGIVELDFLHLTEYVYDHLYQNALSHLRRTGVQFVEQLVKMNPLIIYNTNFVMETSNLVNEPVALVRKQTLVSIDALLGVYPNCYYIIWVWCKVITPMFKDADVKNVELAIEFFKNRVLRNLEWFDKCNKAEHFMPWSIMRTMLSTQSRLYLQTCFHNTLNDKVVSKHMLQVIESHLLTSNSTEAWVLLNFVTGSNVKCKDPDALIHRFVALNSWDKTQNTLISLEVMANCINDFSLTGLNYTFKYLMEHLKDGSIMPSLVGKAFDFLLLIDNRSSKMSKSQGEQEPAWLEELHNDLEQSILDGIKDFPDNKDTLVSHLYAYTEVNLQTIRRPHDFIVKFVHKYISVCINQLVRDFDTENQRLFNAMLVVASRLSLRDPVVARTSCSLFATILEAIDSPPIVNTIIVALNDLCKKHTQLVESIMKRMLSKLSSPYPVNRLATFKCFEKLVLQDQVKLRGSLLLALLATILDESEELATRACAFFAEYLEKKNATLFQKCLVECPFVLNEYKSFNGLDSFSGTSIRSPLSGEAKKKQRQILYNHLITDMKDITLILYFGQLKFLSEKSRTDPLLKTENGLSLIKDIFFILKRICQETKEQKGASKGPGEGEENAADELHEEPSGSQPATSTPKGEKAAEAAALGKGRKQREVTMPQALATLEAHLVYIPQIHENMKDHLEELQPHFDELGKAMWERFPNLVEHAVPASFWAKYRQDKETTASGKSPRRSTNRSKGSPRTSKKGKSGGDETESDSDGDDNEDDDKADTESQDSSFEDDDALRKDEEEAERRGPSEAKRLKVNETPSADLKIEYLFKPNL